MVSHRFSIMVVNVILGRLCTLHRVGFLLC